MRSNPAKSAERRARRTERVKENAALDDISAGLDRLDGPAASQDAPGSLSGPNVAKYPLRRLFKARTKPRRKKSPSRKSLVNKADTAFSRHIRAMYPVSFFSGKPTECCFHIISRGKHSVRWALDNAVGSTMGENYEMEFNPHKFITILIKKRGLLWYETLVRRSNEIKKHTRADLEQIAARGYE